ncbi:histidinol-phosphate transaminase [Pseudactinotalea terrae]|uniref:histidinol-phosphate transaminase n=1 Tax=Pseudactinotalea terrae TaxID=1743262 RepID=UPI0012E23F73|nr:histidinol-phosphate transaminase [Pseudactinotalea terrae]
MPGPSELDEAEQPPAAPERPSVRLRPALETLPAYVPGASGASPGVFKLSSNETPFPPLPAVLSAISDAAEDVNRYPLMYADRVVAEIARHHGQDPERVVVGNGSVAVAELLLRAMCEPGDEVVYAWRSFEAYPIIVQVAGGTSVQVPNTPDGRHDLDAMAAAITDRTRVVIVCTPNNPTGAAVTHAELVAFLEKVPTDVMVLLDEAYAHFVRSADAIDSFSLLSEHKNLVIMRTFAKAYGLAGLRVGYAVARRRLARTLRTASTPFGVNAIAQAAAVAALGQERAVRERVDEIVAERERVVAALRRQGWDIGDPQGNFFWLPLGDASGSFAADALEAGVTVRPFAGDGVRISIGESEANDIVLTLTQRWASISGTDAGSTQRVGGSLQV